MHFDDKNKTLVRNRKKLVLCVSRLEQEGKGTRF